MINIESTELDEEQENKEKRWIPHDFVMNIYDFWVQPHFEKVCSVINMLPDDLNFEVSELGGYQFASQNPASSGLSQRLEDHSLIDEQEIPDSQQGTSSKSLQRQRFGLTQATARGKRNRRDDELRRASSAWRTRGGCYCS
jgi:hypothetical protein